MNAPDVHVPAPVVNIEPGPPANLHVPAPIVNVEPPTVHIPAPVVNVPAPVVQVDGAGITVPAPVVNVTVAEEQIAELRTALAGVTGREIELLTTGTAGLTDDPVNRIGVVQSVGAYTITLRPTRGNGSGAFAVYAIRHLGGFRTTDAAALG